MKFKDFLKGKKLLVLAGGAKSIPLVTRAKELGVYTIVTDMYDDFNVSPAKKFSDEAWCVSWDDIEKLKLLCIENKIDGVLGGFSEFVVDNCIKLCKELNLPCYIDEFQLDITRDKIKFKEFCRRYNLKTIEEYISCEQAIKNNNYPYIVKPVDRAGSIGINICTNELELFEYYQEALNLSPSKTVIIEKYMGECKKIDLYFVVENGNIKMLDPSMSVMCEKFGYKKIVQNGWLQPPKDYSSYVEKNMEKIHLFLKGLKIKYGYIFLSTFLNEDELYFFEAGFRLCGGSSYICSKDKYGFSHLDMLLEYHLTNQVSYNKLSNFAFTSNDVNHFTFNLYVNPCTIKKIEGLDFMKKTSGVLYVERNVYDGQVTTNSGSLLTCAIMIIITFTHVKDFIKLGNLIYETIKVLDENDVNQICDKIDLLEVSKLYE